MSDSQSVTWAAHVRTLCLIYELPDPLSLLQNEDAWSKTAWKNWCSTKVTSYHERLWRDKASSNSKMIYLNIQLAGLTGRHHPALSGLETSRDVERLRPHIKMLAGDYLTYSRIALENVSADPSCRICRHTKPSQPSPPETVAHILTECTGTAEIRERMFPELLNILLTVQPNHAYLTCPPLINNLNHTLTQFLLDCSSFNLAPQYRINISNTRIQDMFKVSRDICWAAHSSRKTKLKILKARSK